MSIKGLIFDTSIYICWVFYCTCSIMSRERDSIANEVKRLRNDFDRYLKAMQEMMFQHVSGPGSVLREAAFISVCDLLIFFCGNGEEGNEIAYLFTI